MFFGKVNNQIVVATSYSNILPKNAHSENPSCGLEVSEKDREIG
ncbi:hypothetical protein [Wolbachia endosymbiont of Oedothorax gibbosus]|nr:hypothetical protein [Wolbachia endosymbiont of Oedothorax gibbosus]